jgi:hypothetical protein
MRTFKTFKKILVSQRSIFAEYESNILSINAITITGLPFIFCIMKTRKNIREKGNTKYVRINNSTWIEADVWIPDEVARTMYLQKLDTTKSSTYLGQLKDYISNINA